MISPTLLYFESTTKHGYSTRWSDERLQETNLLSDNWTRYSPKAVAKKRSFNICQGSVLVLSQKREAPLLMYHDKKNFNRILLQLQLVEYIHNVQY